jgi:hypothetical protein
VRSDTPLIIDQPLINKSLVQNSILATDGMQNYLQSKIHPDIPFNKSQGKDDGEKSERGIMRKHDSPF